MIAHSASTFDEQAPRYDARVGLPESVAAAVASEIVACAGLRTDDLVLELGAGTGEIGTHLARLPVRYVGIDNSAPMLQIFRAKARHTARIIAPGRCRPAVAPRR